MNIVSLILSIIYLFLDVYIYRTSMTMLDDNYACKCGQTWQLKQLSNTIFTIISLQFGLIGIMLILTLLQSMLTIPNMNVLKIMMVLMGLIGLALMGLQIYYIYLMITYVNDLKKNKCMCVDKNYTDTLFYYGWFKITLTVLLVVLGIVNVIKMKTNPEPQQLNQEQLKSISHLLKKSQKHSSKSSHK